MTPQNEIEHSEKKQELLDFSLFSAIARNNIKDVEELLAEGANVNAIICESNLPTESYLESYTALMFAIYQRHYDIAELLAKSGADINAKIDDGWSVLGLLFCQMNSIRIYISEKASEKEENTDFGLIFTGGINRILQSFEIFH